MATKIMAIDKDYEEVEEAVPACGEGDEIATFERWYSKTRSLLTLWILNVLLQT